MTCSSSWMRIQLLSVLDGAVQPTGSRVSNGVFTIGTVGGTAAFTARKGNRSSHIEIEIDVVQGVGNTEFPPTEEGCVQV